MFNSIFNNRCLEFLVFSKWAGNSARDPDPLWFAHSLKDLKSYFHYKNQTKICHANVVIATRWDRNVFFDVTCNSLVSDINDGNLNAMYSTMKSLKITSSSVSCPKTKRVQNSQGQVTINAIQSKEAFREHFSHALKGKTVSFE